MDDFSVIDDGTPSSDLQSSAESVSWENFKRFWWLKLLVLTWLIGVGAGYLFLSIAAFRGNLDSVLGIDGAPAEVVWPLAFCAGGLGATLYAVRGFYWSVGPQGDEPRYKYDPEWTWWYFVRPLLGSLLGLLSYVAIRVALNPVGVAAPETETSVLSFVLVAFASGFSLTSVLGWLDRWINSIFR